MSTSNQNPTSNLKEKKNKGKKMANKKELNIRILMDKLIKKEKEIEACDTSYNINTKYYRQQLINEKNEIIKLLK